MQEVICSIIPELDLRSVIIYHWKAYVFTIHTYLCRSWYGYIIFNSYYSFRSCSGSPSSPRAEDRQDSVSISSASTHEWTCMPPTSAKTVLTARRLDLIYWASSLLPVLKVPLCSACIMAVVTERTVNTLASSDQQRGLFPSIFATSIQAYLPSAKT